MMALLYIYIYIERERERERETPRLMVISMKPKKVATQVQRQWADCN